MPLVALCIAFPTTACAQNAIGAVLFSQIATLRIPDSIRLIVTEGWDQLGVGGARYVFDANVDRAWIARYPRSSTISANGRGFRLEHNGGDVKQYGATGDGRTDDTAAINEALSRGGVVTLSGPGTYHVTDRLVLSVPRTQLKLGSSVTLHTSSWRYRGGQLPFGNAIHITANDCEVMGSGSTSVIQNDRSDANGIGFLHCGGGKVSGIKLIGGKQYILAVTDDTFQSGISIVNDPASNLEGRPSRTIIEDCTITDWTQYGLNIYGSLATDITLRRNSIIRNGRMADRESVGAGVVITRGVGPVILDTNTISENKGPGIFISSAGVEIRSITIANNQIVGNGSEGISCSEEKNFGATGTIGQRDVTIRDNKIEHNGAAGIRAGTYDGVGSISQLVVSGNQISDNGGSGVLLQANTDPARGVDAIIKGNQLVTNHDYGIAVGLNSIRLNYRDNRFTQNRKGDSIDHRSATPRTLSER